MSELIGSGSGSGSGSAHPAAHRQLREARRAPPGCGPWTGATWATWSGAAVALIAAAIASVQAARANRAARDSAEAAKRSADADERAATAAERAIELAEEQAAKHIPDWRLIRVNPITCRLTNQSDERALAVTVTHVDGHDLWVQPQEPEDIQPRESMEVAASGPLAMGANLLVAWARPGGERMSRRVAIERGP